MHGPLALMYHAVTPSRSRPKWPWAISLRNFIDQLDLLRDWGWTTVGPHQLQHPETLPYKAVALTFDDGYADNLPAFEALVARGMIASWYIVTNHIGDVAQWAKPPAPRSRLLDVGQLREMIAAGMEIGSHTCSHCRLTEADATTLSREIGNSKSALEDLLGQEVWHFAYPYGQFDDRAVSVLRATGYRMAFTTRTGWALRDRDPYKIRRIAVFADDTPSSFARKLALADNDVRWRRLAAYYISRIQSRLDRAGASG